jgi:hypothetical protein
MKRQLDKADIINLIENPNYFLDITRPSKDSFQVKILPKTYPCFICNTEINYKLIQIRLDARVTTLTLPKKFCKPCVISVDDLLSRLKTKSKPNWLKVKARF